MIYICIPAHNEEQTVGVVLWKIRQVMADFPRDYQLLVVDDASTDKTPEVLAPYARVLPLTVVRTDQPVGESAAIEMMLREAVRRSEYPKRDVIVTLQADFTQEPDEVVSLIKRTEAGADVVVGEARPDAGLPRGLRWARAMALKVLGRRRMPEGVRDPFTSYRAYRVFAVKKALEDRGGRLVHWNGWAGAAELLLATAPHARRIDTVEIVMRRERMQRASRQQPWAALKAVWSLARSAKPVQVATPADLDQAMRGVVASRTSEVAAAMARPQRNGRGRGNTESKRRQRSEPTGERPRQRRTERPRMDKPVREPKAPRTAAAKKAAVEEAAPEQPMLPMMGEPVTPPPKKKRRRKRKKSNGAAAAAPVTQEVAELAVALDALLEQKEEAVVSGEGDGSEGEAPKAKRRRRGRRGGRRRRSGQTSPESGDAEKESMDEVPGDDDA